LSEKLKLAGWPFSSNLLFKSYHNQELLSFY